MLGWKLWAFSPSVKLFSFYVYVSVYDSLTLSRCVHLCVSPLSSSLTNAAKLSSQTAEANIFSHDSKCFCCLRADMVQAVYAQTCILLVPGMLG